MSLRDLRRHVGQLAIVGFPGHAIPADLKRMATEFDLGGVIYFARNIAEPGQVADLSTGKKLARATAYKLEAMHTYAIEGVRTLPTST